MGSSAQTQASISLPLYVAVVPAIAWAGNFVVLRFALDYFGPLALTALRFLIIGSTVLLFGWPKLPWKSILLYAFLSAGGQYTLSTLAVYAGLSPGLASLVMQGQVFFAVLLAYVALRERPGAGTMIGVLLGFSGLAVLTLSKGQAFSSVGFTICLAAAFFWAAASLQLRMMKWGNFFSLQAASSLIAFPVLALLSWQLDKRPFNVEAIVHAPFNAIGCLAYMSVVSLFIAQTIWGRLIASHPVSSVTPFALLIPAFGLAFAYFFLGDALTSLQYISCGVILIGLAAHFFSVGRMKRA